MLDNEIKNENVVEEDYLEQNTEDSSLNEQVSEEITTNEKLKFADRVKAKEAQMKPGFKKGLYVLIMYFAILFVDIHASFRRSPAKYGAFLIAAPGIFIGFFLNFEIDTIYPLTARWAAFCMFVLVLCGCVNIFEAFEINKNRDLKSIIIAGLIALLIAVCGIVYIVDVNKAIKDQGASINSTNIKSFICVGLSSVLGLIGVLIAFIFRDKNYKKDKF